MGSAIAKALLGTSWVRAVFASNPQKPHVMLSLSKPEKKRFRWKKVAPFRRINCLASLRLGLVDNTAVVKAVDIVVIAVRPGVVAATLQEIRPFLKKKQILISIAAGTPLKKLKKWSGGHKKIVRVMPNLPAQVFDGMSVWKPAQGLSKKEKTAVKKFLESFGKQIEVKDEKLIDMATAIGGGGPAYTAAFLESMTKAAKRIGFSESDARLLAIQTVDGSLDYIKETGIEFNQLKSAVQTKGGTTETGFKILKKKKWQATLEKALFAGYKRAREISKK
ncbi:NAD(P)-binding domain-containing protein [Candidatus Peregrinibacteria bacterium]|nr:NAD(P)-binding domain-containing protein [Candidatus Peregrinibacteria bacterium]